ncbi:hypothetical protein Y032_0004g2244 [Ancylostoma ceylanicum]|uniref:C2H2-type domain-containing protein n=1 Tax=Ancylostoma ceylanicum TaxID=53326 RepID=A0A016VX85_9BILA|nr:hypothetical protein Y032_0004g2244 [Ancylostoma ceylanicum]
MGDGRNDSVAVKHAIAQILTVECKHDGCNKAFSLEANLKSHMKTHTGTPNRAKPGIESTFTFYLSKLWNSTG